MSRHRHYRESSPDWGRAYMPQRCEECGQWYFPGAENPLMDAAQGLYGALMEGMSQMYGDMMAPMMGGGSRHRGGSHYEGKHHKHKHHQHHHHHKHDCDCCHDDYDCGCGGRHCDCHCRCCIGDADLVIYSRLGEARVVPLTIENGRRRERKVTLELSEWKTSGGREVPGLVVNAAVTPDQFDLGACEEGDAILVLRSALVEDKVEPRDAAAEAKILNVSKEALREQPRFPDVDECTVLYADLRVEGCDIRPLRIALALLPRDCGAFEIECRCGCC